MTGLLCFDVSLDGGLDVNKGGEYGLGFNFRVLQRTGRADMVL